tara:strand:- start:904 stop:1887 length:984 start_codon:yes stop_codon:yes gene_type:complete
MTSKKKQETMSEATKCAICWEDIGEKNKSVMGCGHSFHFSCITSNILKGAGDHSLNCPLCRELIVDKEFEDCYVEIRRDDDTDSMPELEEEEEDVESYQTRLWGGSQIWRRDLRLRDRVKISFDMDTTGEMLNRMGWDIKDDDIITTRYDDYEDNRAVIFCEVVRIATEPHEESDGLAPFLLKPLDGRNRLQVQAYQPSTIEVIDIELSVGWRDEPIGGYSTDEEAEDRVREEEIWEEMNREAVIQFNRTEAISKRQIHDKPVHEIMETIDEKIEKLGLLSICTYKKRTIRSMIHKITMDILMEHKREQENDISVVNDSNTMRYARI